MTREDSENFLRGLRRGLDQPSSRNPFYVGLAFGKRFLAIVARLERLEDWVQRQGEQDGA